MSLWEVLALPSALVLATTLLAATAWLERRFLSPRSLITLAVRVRNTPEHAEQLVSGQADLLLRAERR